MNILIVGLGVIGSTYGFIFQKAGHHVEHFIRDDKKDKVPNKLDVLLLDGRYSSKGEPKEDYYNINLAGANRCYDFILISVSSGKLESAIKALTDANCCGSLIIFSGIWDDRVYLNHILDGWDYILGYPVAGGNINSGFLSCCLFDHIILEHREKTNIQNYDLLLSLLSDSNIKSEMPFDVLEWIWLHMAINAGVITTAGKFGNVKDVSKSAEQVMASSKALAEAVLAIRETTKIIAFRGVDLKKYNNELIPYKIPTKIAAFMMKKMFANNLLTRKIMTLHSNINDLRYVCRSVYECGKNNNISAPIFYTNYIAIQNQIEK